MDGNIAFEGEYLYGEKNGKGKAYDIEAGLEIEEEYLYGKRWNCKIYDNSKNITYELKNGKGYAKEDNGDLIFEGEYLYGEKSGKGKEYDYIIIL